MFCPKCGKEIPANCTFCPNCGTKPHASTAGARKAAPGRQVPGPARHAAHPGRPPLVPLVAGVAAIAVAALVVVPALTGNASPFSAIAGAGGHEAVAEEASSGAGGLWGDGAAGSSDEEGKGSDGLTKKRYEDYTVSDVRVEPDAEAGPRIVCTVTNNTDRIGQGVGVSASGTLTVVDDYGDEQTTEESLDVITTASGSTTVPYLFPGENEVELIPSDQGNVVASYTSSYSGETQRYGLDDVSDVTVDASGGKTLDPDQYAVLDADDYDIELTQELGGVLKAKITNNTDYKWKSVQVYVVAVDRNGNLAHETNSEYNGVAFQCGPLSEQYFNPGDTKEMSDSFNSSLDVDHFEVTRVVVEKELGKASEA